MLNSVKDATSTRPAHHLPPLFDGLIPVVQDDDTIAVYGVDAAGDRTDQPLIVADAGTLAFFATNLGNAIRTAR